MMITKSNTQSRSAVYKSFLVLLLLLCATAIYAQNEAGQLTGKVTDPNGAVVAGAAVSIKSVETGITRTATSNSEGFFNIPSLQPGLYDVTIQSSGFAARTQRVRVSVGSALKLDTQLSVTPVTEKQEIVEASGGVAVNTQNYQLSDPISGNQIRELPTIQRDPYELVTLSGNVTPVNPTNGAGAARSNVFAINGRTPNANNFHLDGGENLDTLTSGLGMRIPLEAVQEIQVITNTFRPEYGRAGGGIINVATRQGTNEWHGSLFEFHRNSEFSSNSFENKAWGIPQGRFVANQFGYSVGGPLRQDRVFFFNSTEANLVRSRGNQVALVPSTQLLALSAANTQAFFNQFPLGTTTPVRTFTVAETNALLGLTTTTGNAFTSLPSTTPAFNLVSFSVPGNIGGGLPQDSISTVGRLDFNHTEHSTIYARYAFDDRDLYNGTFAFSPFSNFNAGSRERNHSGVLNWLQTFGQSWVSNSKVSFNYLNSIRNFGTPSTRLLLTNGFGTNIGGFNVGLPGFQQFAGNTNTLFTGPVSYGGAYQDFTAVWHRQQIRFGASYHYTRDNRTWAGLQNSVAVLGASVPQALNNLVLGEVSTFQTAVNPNGVTTGQPFTLPAQQPNFNRSIAQHDFAGYFAHVWRAHPRVNVNWGLRYDYFGVPRSRNGQVFSNFVLGEGSNSFIAVSNGQLMTVGSNTSNRLYQRVFNNVAPRIGFAIDLTGNGKTALRGGYGITYERTAGNALYSIFHNTSNFALANFTANTGTTGNLLLTTNNFGTLGGTTGTVTFPLTSVNAVERNIEAPMVHTWNLVLEREIAPNTVASISYVGSAGRNLLIASNVNRPGSAAAFLDTTNPTARLNPAFGPIYLLSSDGRSNYHAGIAELSNSSWRRIGLQFSARYRFARALDNVSASLSGLTPFTTNALDPFNPNFDYGNSDFDVRHRFIGSFNWEVPFDKIGDRYFGGTGTGIARQIFGGWAITGIMDAHSGFPFSVYNCAGAVTAEAPCPRLAPTGGISFAGSDNPAATTIANRLVFIGVPSQDLAATPGTVFQPFAATTTTRNAFRGPRFWNVDAALHKRFRFTETASLQFRAELFNVFNRANLFIPGNAIDVSSAGFIPAFRSGQRNLQLAVKLLF